MRILAAAVFAGLALLSASVVYTADDASNDRYDAAPQIAQAWADAIGLRVDEIRHVSGPFVVVDRGEECLLVDVSTRYAREGSDLFWIAVAEDARSLNC